MNNVERGQPDIYVVLEEAEIGIRIRESFSVDIDRLSMFQESMGMLDVTLRFDFLTFYGIRIMVCSNSYQAINESKNTHFFSIPPKYGVRPDGDNTRDQEYRQRYNLPRVSGLLRPFPDQTMGMFTQGLSINDVNSESIRQQIVQFYRIPGTSGAGTTSTIGVIGQFIPTGKKKE